MRGHDRQVGHGGLALVLDVDVARGLLGHPPVGGVAAVVALEIGTSELMLLPQYPDGEQECSDIAKLWMSRTSVNMDYSTGHTGSRQKMAVREWRHAAQRVVTELVRRGVTR